MCCDLLAAMVDRKPVGESDATPIKNPRRGRKARPSSGSQKKFHPFRMRLANLTNVDSQRTDCTAKKIGRKKTERETVRRQMDASGKKIASKGPGEQGSGTHTA